MGTVAILLAEHDNDLRQYLRSFFLAHECTVTEAHDPAGILRAIRQNRRFDLLVTNASLGYRRPTLRVRGTTCTRFKYLLAASLLRMIAGRCLRISPPTDGSKLTHQTSPRSIADITDGGL